MGQSESLFTNRNTRNAADDGIAIRDVVQAFLLSKWIVLSLLCLSLLGGAGLIVLTSQRWEAYALVQVGQVGKIGPDATGRPIEPLSRALERVKTSVFHGEVLSSLGLSVEAAPDDVALYTDSLKVRALGGADLLELRVQGYSPEQARRFAEATVRELREVHEQLAGPSLDAMRKQLTLINGKIASLQNEREELRAMVSQGARSDRILTDTATAFVAVTIDSTLQEQEQLRAEYEMALRVASVPTQTIIPSKVSDKPVAPHIPLIIGIAFAVGSILSFIAMMVLWSYRPQVRTPGFQVAFYSNERAELKTR